MLMPISMADIYTAIPNVPLVSKIIPIVEINTHVKATLGAKYLSIRKPIITLEMAVEIPSADATIAAELGSIPLSISNGIKCVISP